MLGVLVALVVAAGIYLLIWPILRELFWPEQLNIPTEPRPASKTTIKNEEQVTVDDMIIHDMVNPDDTWDIGEVNFNE